jgi:hypothetical protein
MTHYLISPLFSGGSIVFNPTATVLLHGSMSHFISKTGHQSNHHSRNLGEYFLLVQWLTDGFQWRASFSYDWVCRQVSNLLGKVTAAAEVSASYSVRRRTVMNAGLLTLSPTNAPTRTNDPY